jgi:ABC-type branched-subunit amino acid transport system substrate-binding protein
VWLLLALLLPACAAWRSPQVVRVALLGPFEGRYREVGYNALYAARLALRDSGDTPPTLLPIDDGGSVATAVERAQALALDRQVRVVIAVGYAATAPETQAAYGDLPVLIPGNWTSSRTTDTVFLLANPNIEVELTISAQVDVVEAAEAPAPLIGGDVLGLSQFTELREALEDVTLLTVGQLSNEDFVARYKDGEQFAPEPNVLAMLTYDATRLAASVVHDSRSAASSAIAEANYSGLSGQLAFTDGVWTDAPRHAFVFADDGTLLAVDDLIEER